MDSKIEADLKVNYTKAVEAYNEGDFGTFLNNIRPAVLLFAKYIIYDILGGDGGLASNFINGRMSLEYPPEDKKGDPMELRSNPTPTEIESSFFIELAKRVIFYKRPDIFKADTRAGKIGRLRKDIVNACSEMRDIHSKSSEIEMHREAQTDLKIDVQAPACANSFPGIIDSLSRILSEDAKLFLNSLPKPNSTVPMRSEEVARALDKHNDLIMLDEITDRFSQGTDVNYVAFMPEKLTDKYGGILSAQEIQPFFNLKWLYLVDLNPKTADGLYEQAPSEVRSSLIRIVTDSNSDISKTSDLINWLFARGRIDLQTFDEQTTLKTTPKMFRDIFSKIVKTGSTSDYLIFDFCQEDYKLTERLLNALEYVFRDWDSVQKHCKIISFKNSTNRERLEEWANDYGLEIKFVDISFGEFIEHIVERVEPKKSRIGLCPIKIKGKIISEGERERFRAAGIEFFSPSNIQGTDREWDFYSGAEIIWEELEQSCDVQRDAYKKLYPYVDDTLRTMRRTKVITLRHRPGSGATTLSRRLGFDIMTANNTGTLSSIVVEIRGGSNIRMTRDYLCQLSEVMENTPILVIVEAKRIGKEKFNDLVKWIADAGKKILFFYIEPYTGPISTARKQDYYYLDSILSNEDEQNRFIERYKRLGLDEKLLGKAARERKYLEIIDFPLMLRDKEVSTNLSSYVQEWLAAIPNESLKKFCAYVSFIYKYSDLGVNQRILKSIWCDDQHFALKLYENDALNAMKHLLIEETKENVPTGIWRPRYNKFAKFILDAYKVNWEYGIPEMAREIIKLCEDAKPLGSDDNDMLHSIFIMRKNADYRTLEDKKVDIRNKFSLLVKDIDDTERSEVLFKTLINAFPEDALFRAHFARFLYEKATVLKVDKVDDQLFFDAQEQLDVAMDLNPHNPDLYHMKGMLLRRKMGALGRMLDVERKEKGEVGKLYYEDYLQNLTDSACDAFEKSIEYDPASPYGYAGESQLFMEAINLGKKLGECDDYSFCGEKSIYENYTERLGMILDRFEGICYAFKEEGLSQIMESRPIYDKVRIFHRNIIGNNKESIRRYRILHKNAVGEERLQYASFLLRSILYSATGGTDTRRALGNLDYEKRKEAESLCEEMRNNGNVQGYEQLFLLKLYGNEEYSLDDAINLLREWESQYKNSEQVGIGYLNVCFYLGICYSAKAIRQKTVNSELINLVNSYFKESEKLAKSFDRGTVSPQYFFGEREDIHCIVDRNRRDSDAYPVSGVIMSIKNGKGILKLSCGLEVSFTAKGFESLRDEGLPLHGTLGFRYSGLGLYELRRDGDFSEDSIIDDWEDAETSYEELSKSYEAPEDLVEESVRQNEVESREIKAADQAKEYIKGPTVVGKVDISQIGHRSSEGLVDGKEYEGTIVLQGGKKKISFEGCRYPLLMEGSIPDELYEEDNVIFTLSSRPNEKDPNKTYRFATDVRLKDED